MQRRTGQKSTLENLFVDPTCKTEPYEEEDVEVWVKCAQQKGKISFVQTAIAVVVIVTLILVIGHFVSKFSNYEFTPLLKLLVVGLGLGILIFSGVKNLVTTGPAARNEWKYFATELDTQFHKKTGKHIDEFTGDERKAKWTEAVKYFEERSELERKEDFELKKAREGATRVNVFQSSYGQPSERRSVGENVAQGVASAFVGSLFHQK